MNGDLDSRNTCKDRHVCNEGNEDSARDVKCTN
jgi:hypothetical protein